MNYEEVQELARESMRLMILRRKANSLLRISAVILVLAIFCILIRR